MTPQSTRPGTNLLYYLSGRGEQYWQSSADSDERMAQMLGIACAVILGQAMSLLSGTGRRCGGGAPMGMFRWGAAPDVSRSYSRRKRSIRSLPSRTMLNRLRRTAA